MRDRSPNSAGNVYLGGRWVPCEVAEAYATYRATGAAPDGYRRASADPIEDQPEDVLPEDPAPGWALYALAGLTSWCVVIWLVR